MSNVLRIKRRDSTGGAGAPTVSQIVNGELAFNEATDILYYGKGGSDSAAGSIIAIGGNGAFVDMSSNQTISGIKTFSSTILGTINNSLSSGFATTANSATTADRWSNARTITLGGDAIGSVSIDGSSNVTLTVQVLSSAQTYDANNLTGDTLASGVVNSSLTSVGTINSGTWQGSPVLSSYIGNLPTDKITTGTFVDARIPNLDAGKITTGTFADARIPSLDTSKITTGTFADARIPLLSANKITTGTFVDARIPTLSADKIGFGTFVDARIPNLDTSKITTGTFVDARIPNLDTSKITTGTFADARIPLLSANKIAFGTFSTDRIPNLDAGKITTGTFADARIPTLSASKIGFGTFADARISSSSVTQHSNNITSLGVISNLSATNITTTGVLYGPATFYIDPAIHGDNTGTVVIKGNLQVDGTTTTINSTVVTIDDLNFVIASDQTTLAGINGAGIFLGDDGAGGGEVEFVYDNANSRMVLNTTGTQIGLKIDGNLDGAIIDGGTF
jgi:hypothetical protein